MDEPIANLDEIRALSAHLPGPRPRGGQPGRHPPGAADEARPRSRPVREAVDQWPTGWWRSSRATNRVHYKLGEANS